MQEKTVFCGECGVIVSTYVVLYFKIKYFAAISLSISYRAAPLVMYNISLIHYSYRVVNIRKLAYFIR